MRDRNINIVIHGSCITRDIFRINPVGFTIKAYYARSCITSIVSTPLDIDDDDLPGLTSNFQRRMVVNDFKKQIFEQLKSLDFDYFFIDFIDERFNLLKSNSSSVTKSAELINSKYLAKTNINFLEINRLNYPLSSWKNDCDIYIEKLCEAFNPDKIIIIKSKWAERFLDVSGEIREFNGINHFEISYIKKMNELLENYYDYICSQLPMAACISYPPVIAYEKHEWGLSPFHYLREQYEAVYKEIFSITHQ